MSKKLEKAGVLKVVTVDEVIASHKQQFKEQVENLPTDKEIANLKALTIGGIDDKDGFSAVRTGRTLLRNSRIIGEKVIKAFKGDVIKEGRALDDLKKTWTERFLQVEASMKTKENEYEELVQVEKDRLKKEKDEFIARRAKILMDLGMVWNGANYEGYTHSVDNIYLEKTEDDAFQSFVETITDLKRGADEIVAAAKAKEEQKAAEARELERQEKEKQDKIKSDEQAAKDEVDRKEKHRLKAEAEELAKNQADLDAREAKLKEKEEAAAKEEEITDVEFEEGATPCPGTKEEQVKRAIRIEIREWLISHKPLEEPKMATNDDVDGIYDAIKKFLI